MIPFIWSTYSRRTQGAILKLEHAGRIENPQGRLVEGGIDGQIWLFLDVDESNGRVQRARFLFFGPTLLAAACEGLCSLVEGKSVAQAARISTNLISRQIDGESVFTVETRGFIEIAREALFDALGKCSDITPGVISPINAIQLDGDRPDFDALTQAERLFLIESVLDEEIRPYIELDGGSIAVKALKGHRLIITYEGACTTCPAAFGTTLQSITGVLQKTVCKEIVVEPDGEEVLSNFV